MHKCIVSICNSVFSLQLHVCCTSCFPGDIFKDNLPAVELFSFGHICLYLDDETLLGLFSRVYEALPAGKFSKQLFILFPCNCTTTGGSIYALDCLLNMLKKQKMIQKMTTTTIIIIVVVLILLLLLIIIIIIIYVVTKILRTQIFTEPNNVLHSFLHFVDGGLLVCETFLNSTATGPLLTTYRDMAELGCASGGERTAEEYINLLTKASFVDIQTHSFKQHICYDIVYARKPK